MNVINEMDDSNGYFRRSLLCLANECNNALKNDYACNVLMDEILKSIKKNVNNL